MFVYEDIPFVHERIRHERNPFVHERNPFVHEPIIPFVYERIAFVHEFDASIGRTALGRVVADKRPCRTVSPRDDTAGIEIARVDHILQHCDGAGRRQMPVVGNLGVLIAPSSV